MSTSRKKILIVEDDLNFGSILADFLRLHSFNVTLSKNGINVHSVDLKKSSLEDVFLDLTGKGINE